MHALRDAPEAYGGHLVDEIAPISVQLSETTEISGVTFPEWTRGTR